MPEPFTHLGNMQDQYQVFVIPTGFTEPTEIAAVEIRPGNRAVDHHALIGYTDDPVVIAEAQAKDAADPNPGYESFGDYGWTWISFCLAVGCQARLLWNSLPPLARGSTRKSLAAQMHYGPSAVEQTDQTEINLFLLRAHSTGSGNVHHGPHYLDGDGAHSSFQQPRTTFHGSVTMWRTSV